MLVACEEVACIWVWAARNFTARFGLIIRPSGTNRRSSIPGDVHIAVDEIQDLALLESFRVADGGLSLAYVVHRLESVVRAEGRAQLVVLGVRVEGARVSTQPAQERVSPVALAVEAGGVFAAVESARVERAVGNESEIVHFLGMGRDHLESERVALGQADLAVDARQDPCRPRRKSCWSRASQVRLLAEIALVPQNVRVALSVLDELAPLLEGRMMTECSSRP